MAETRTIRTVLELNAQRFTAGAAQASASAKSLANELRKINGAMIEGDLENMSAKQVKAMREQAAEAQRSYNTVSNSLLGIGAAAAAGLGAASKAAMDWESAWAGVRKTVDGTDAEMAALEESLRGLAKELPASHEEIAAVAEAAGQLGVAREDIVDFTRTMINLGETTNLSADEAATSIAQFTNVMGTSADDVDNLGSALVALGNDGASTEADIMNMAQRLSGAGKLIGASEQDILGLASALSSVGISAEAGGGSLSRVLQKINTDVLEGGDALTEWAQVAGMSAEDFATAWRESPTEALDLFLQGLNGVTESGGNAVGTLKDLGVTSTEETRALLSLAGAGDLLSESLVTSNDAWAENVALTQEAAERYKTTEAQLQLAKNAIVDAGIDLGAAVLPVLADVAEGVAGVADWFSALPGPLQSAVTGFGGIVAAAGLAAGGLMKAVPAAMDTVQAFKDLRTQSPRTASAIGKVSKAVGILGGAFTAASIVSSYGDSLTDFSMGANEAAVAVNSLADSASPMATVFDGMIDSQDLATMSADDMALGLDRLANGRWWSGLHDLNANLSNAFGANAATLEEQTERYNEVGEALAGLADTDLPAAAEGFKAMWDEMGGTTEVGENLLKVMPAFKDELIGIADAAGLATDDQTLLQIAVGDLVPVVDEATGEITGYVDAQGQAEGATSDTTGEVTEQVDALAELQDQLQETANTLLGYRSGMRDLEAAYDDATAAVEENGQTLDITTEAGRANQAALDAIADATHGAADSAEEYGASASDLDDILADGRDKFIETAEAMGLLPDEAEALADQLGLIPDVEITVRLKEEVLPSVNDLIEGVYAEIEVGADTDPAETKFDGLVSTVNTAEPEFIVDADTYYAEEQLRLFNTAITEAGGTVEINGDTMTATEAFDTLIDEINEGEGVVNINGHAVDAETALLQLIGYINSSDGEVTIEANTDPALHETDKATAHADNSTGTIDVEADTSDANSDINHTARDRSSSVTADARTSSAESALNHVARARTVAISAVFTSGASIIQSALGRADGGWIQPGLAGGGWVPGPYPGKGIDNTWMPVRSGLAEGGYAMQPLAGTEFVVNGQSARQWGPALEAMNAGASPQAVAAAVGGGFSVSQQISGLNAYEVARESRAQMEHVARSQAIVL